MWLELVLPNNMKDWFLLLYQFVSIFLHSGNILDIDRKMYHITCGRVLMVSDLGDSLPNFLK